MSSLSPQRRDALLAELRTRTNAPGFHFLDADHLQRLNELESNGAPVVSLYMGLTPEMRIGDAWEIAFKELRSAALSDAQANGHEAAVAAELDRIHAALNNGLPRTGRGVAFFACQAIGLFRQLGVAIAMPNDVEVAPRPYVRPLARVRDEHDRFVIALVSAHKSRFFFSQIGLVEEVYVLEGEELAVTDYASKDQRQDMKAELKKDQAQRSAHALQLIAKTLGARHIIYAAPADMEASFLDGLNQQAREKVAASFQCAIHASTAEVAEKAEAVQRQVEAREEMETVARVRESIPARAVAGLDEVLDMLNQQRVLTLLVNDDLRIPGGVDSQTGMLTTLTEGTYPPTGGAIHPEDDLFEVMMERALQQGASLELVRSEAAKDALAQHGPSAALLRF
ncbi:MAG: peptide chain release factor 1 [Rhodothermaceae bacterium]|nr:peptide chain release factor 1 [Rhodothermaceae bacterium]